MGTWALRYGNMGIRGMGIWVLNGTQYTDAEMLL